MQHLIGTVQDDQTVSLINSRRFSGRKVYSSRYAEAAIRELNLSQYIGKVVLFSFETYDDDGIYGAVVVSTIG